MLIKKIGATVLTALTMLTFSSEAFAEKKELMKVNTAWVVGQEAFPVWYAKKQGWDKEQGFELQMTVYASGQEALQDFDVNNWVYGGLGAIPVAMEATNTNMQIIGVANDESAANAIMVRPASPILNTKGANAEYPRVYGDKASVENKSFWTTENSSAQYTLHVWLKRLGLTEANVDVKNIDQALSLVSFGHGRGDGLTLWAPYTFVGDQNGWVTVATAKDVDAALPIFLVANKAFAEQYEDVTKNFLMLYMSGVEWLMNASRDEAVKALQEYYQDVFNLDYSHEMVSLHLDTIQLFDLAQQKALLNDSEAVSIANHWKNEIARFFASTGAIKQQDLEAILAGKTATAKYMNMLTEASVK